jgi:cytochrome P450
MPDPREGEEFFLSVPQRLDNPFPDLQYFREHRPVFYDPPLQTWFVFRYDNVAALFHGTKLSSTFAVLRGLKSAEKPLLPSGRTRHLGGGS